MLNKIDKHLLASLKMVTIFSGLKKSELSLIIKGCHIVTFRAGGVIVKEKTPATDIYILLEGKVEIILNPRGPAIKLAEFGPGNCFGEASVIGIQNHTANVIVLEDARLLVLSRVVLMKILKTKRRLFSMLILNISRELARRLHQTNQILLQYVQK